MRKRFLVLVCAVASVMTVAFAGGAEKQVFSSDEKLEYMGYFQWGALKFDGIDIVTQVSPEKFVGVDAYSITASAVTKKTIKTFFQMSDTFMVKVRKTDLAPLYFYEHDQEKNYEAFFKYEFQPMADGMAVSAWQQRNGDVKTHEVKYNGSFPTDALSILYRVRGIDFNGIKAGDTFVFTNYIFADEPLDMSIVYEETELIKLRKQSDKVEAMRFRFNTADGSLFSKENPVYIWIETAPAHRLVHVEAKLKIGYAKLDIKQ